MTERPTPHRVMSDPSSAPHAACWRRLDIPGHDAVRVAPLPDGWRLDGAVALAHAGVPAALCSTVTWPTSRSTRTALCVATATTGSAEPG